MYIITVPVHYFTYCSLDINATDTYVSISAPSHSFLHPVLIWNGEINEERNTKRRGTGWEKSWVIRKQSVAGGLRGISLCEVRPC